LGACWKLIPKRELGVLAEYSFLGSESFATERRCYLWLNMFFRLFSYPVRALFTDLIWFCSERKFVNAWI
jgi:hypothetical protein